MGRLVGLLLVLLVLGLGFRALERRWPVVEGQRRRARTVLTDLAYLVLAPPITRLALAAAIVLALVVLSIATGERWTFEQALSARHEQAWVASWPLWAQALAIALLDDLLGYWIHRLFHRAPRLWRMHAIHHGSRELDWLASVRVHPLSGALTRLLRLAPLVLLGFDPRIVAGVGPVLLIYALLLHANVRWDFGPLRYVIASPAFHRWHHAADEAGRDKNFAGLLPVWDLVFGTFYMPRGEWPQACGVAEELPEGFWAQLRWPLRAPASVSPPTS